jgi:hypothetical protein
VKLNKQFNRYESMRGHEYIEFLGDNLFQKKVIFEGYVKCKLMHGLMGSVIVPDFLFYQVEENRFKFIQPLAFRANQIFFDDKEGYANVMIDISAQTTVNVRFKKSGFVRSLNDYSELYECEINASTDISEHFTGEGYFSKDFVPFIKTYHHTTQIAYSKIIESSYLINSRWNIGGTKELRNIGYVYFTPLDKLKHNADLIQVAMSDKGFIYLVSNTGAIRRVNIYRRFVKDFESTLEFWLDTQSIAPSHLFRRLDSIGGVYYQIVAPFIQRVGMIPDTLLAFQNDVIHDSSKKADYIILGDCNYMDGLIAPYDEENTDYIFKIEKQDGSNNLFDFWHDNANTDQYSNKQVEYQQFNKSE